MTAAWLAGLVAAVVALAALLGVAGAAGRAADRIVLLEIERTQLELERMRVEQPLLGAVFDENDDLRGTDRATRLKLAAYARMHLDLFQAADQAVPWPALPGRRRRFARRWELAGRRALERSTVMRQALQEAGPRYDERFRGKLHPGGTSPDSGTEATP